MLGASSITYRRATMFSNDPGAVVAHVIFSIIDAMALTALVFLRRSFGERFYTVFKYGLGIAILSFLMVVRELFAGLVQGAALLAGGPLAAMAAGGMMSGSRPRPGLFDATHLLYWGFILAGGVQLGAVLLRSWRIGNAVPVHSKSTGQPLLSFGGRINHWVTTIFLEPLAVLFAAYVLSFFDPNLPMSYFMMLALFLEVSAVHQWRLCRDDMLDEQDARILAGFYADQAKHVAAGNKPSLRLGRIFMPFILPRMPKLQVDTLRRWADRYREAANDKGAPSSLPASNGASEETPPAPPPSPSA